MEKSSIYEDIALRTEGDIYIGVVGPVRTGKSTFIKSFMETMVLPRIDNVYLRERAKDELPQSGSGRTIMTAEPKFVPEDAVDIALDENTHFNVRMIDCVGYMIDGALGQLEGDAPRMVSTPWFDHEVSLREAAETGTRKVITEHSTIGIVVTTDGTISDLPREEYIQAEERVVEELKELQKPFVLVLNSVEPRSPEAQKLRRQLLEQTAENLFRKASEQEAFPAVLQLLEGWDKKDGKALCDDLIHRGVRFVALGFAEGESLGVIAAQKKSKKMMPLGRALKEFFPAHEGKGGGSDALGQGTVPLSAWDDFAALCAPFLQGEGAE